MKILNRALSLLLSPLTIGLTVTTAFIYLAILYYVSATAPASTLSPVFHLLHTMHQKSIDLRMNLRGPLQGSERVAVLTVDEKAIEQEGRWPWPREKIARVVDNAVKHGAKVLAFDMIFSEADQNSAIPTLNRIKKHLSERQIAAPELTGILDTEIERANSDRALADSIAKNGAHLVMGAYFDSPEIGGPAYQDACFHQLFARSPDFTYWDEKEEIRTFVTDEFAKSLPEPVAARLETYLSRMEAKEIQTWLSENPEIKAAFASALQNNGLELEEDSFAPILHLWLNGKHNDLKGMLGEVKPEIKEEAGYTQLSAAIGGAIQEKDRAALAGLQRTVGDAYCFRFLTRNDELLDKSLYLKMWQEDESYADLNWEKAWAEASGKGGRELASQEASNAINEFKASQLSNPVPEAGRWWLNIPMFSAVTKHSGFFNANQDSDGTIRRAMLLVRKGNGYMPSLALKAFLVAHDYTLDIRMKDDPIDPSSKAVAEFSIRDADGNLLMTIPTDNSARLPINYAGPRQMFPYVSLADLLNDDSKVNVEHQEIGEDGKVKQVRTTEMEKSEFFKDKLFIVGATATGIYDLRVTPFEENYPGVETHANVLSNLLVENDRAVGKGKPGPGFLVKHPGEENYMLGTIAVLGISMSALLTHLGAVAGLILAASTLAAIAMVDNHVLFNNGVVVSVLLPLLLVLALYVILTFYKYFTEERKKRELKGTFEKYVSPAIVAEVLSDPSKIELGGRKTELTVFFSDVRGFTTISEKLDPRALSDLLNSYLTPMTELVFKNKGTLDKYMGDAIMAFFGAPIHFSDHAKHACRCALQHIEKLEELRQVYRAKGLPDIDIGIGLNTGDMSVGNMGSDTVRSYTVMGDAVNLGSRLEGINKQYGTRIIISEFTQKHVADDFITREVDWVKVKGKALPVRIFELVAEQKTAAETMEMLKWFNQGFHLYHEKAFDRAILSFTSALNINPADACSQLYVERCQDYITEPPPSDWDGVFTMTSK